MLYLKNKTLIWLYEWEILLLSFNTQVPVFCAIVLNTYNRVLVYQITNKGRFLTRTFNLLKYYESTHKITFVRFTTLVSYFISVLQTRHIRVCIIYVGRNLTFGIPCMFMSEFISFSLLLFLMYVHVVYWIRPLLKLFYVYEIIQINIQNFFLKLDTNVL